MRCGHRRRSNGVKRHVKQSTGIDTLRSVAAAGAFFVGKHFQAGGPPAGGDGFNGSSRHAFALHLSGQAFEVVIHGNELHFYFRALDAHQRIPHVRRAAVLRPAQHFHVDTMAAA